MKNVNWFNSKESTFCISFSSTIWIICEYLFGTVQTQCLLTLSSLACKWAVIGRTHSARRFHRITWLMFCLFDWLLLLLVHFNGTLALFLRITNRCEYRSICISAILWFQRYTRSASIDSRNLTVKLTIFFAIENKFEQTNKKVLRSKKEQTSLEESIEKVNRKSQSNKWVKKSFEDVE